MVQPDHLFVYFRTFQEKYYINILDSSGIRAWIVKIECKYVDHLTTTTLVRKCCFWVVRWRWKQLLSQLWHKHCPNLRRSGISNLTPQNNLKLSP